MTFNLTWPCNWPKFLFSSENILRDLKHPWKITLGCLELPLTVPVKSLPMEFFREGSPTNGLAGLRTSSYEKFDCCRLLYDKTVAILTSAWLAGRRHTMFFLLFMKGPHTRLSSCGTVSAYSSGLLTFQISWNFPKISEFNWNFLNCREISWNFPNFLEIFRKFLKFRKNFN